MHSFIDNNNNNNNNNNNTKWNWTLEQHPRREPIPYVMLSANGLVGPGFASLFRILNAQWVDVKQPHPLLSH